MNFWQGFSSLINAVGRPWRISFGGSAAPPIERAESDSGVVVTHDKALTLSAVWGCVGLISQTISTLPASIFKTEGDRSTPAPDHSWHALIHDRPNANMTAVQFWQMEVASLLLWGNGYAEKRRANNVVVALDPLLPQYVTPYLNDRGLLRYKFADGKRTEDFSGDDVLHIKGLSLDGLVGVSPLAYARHSLGRALSTEETAGSMFKNALTKRVVFKLDKYLKPEQREEFRTNLVAFQGAANAGKPFLLEGGMSVDSLTMSPEDAELLATRGFSVEDICRWFYRTPPQLIGHIDKASSWASSLENTNLGFLTYTLRPIITEIEQAINKALAPDDRKQYFAKFRIQALMRADSAGRSALYASALQNGWMNRDGVRALEDLDPMGDGGEVYTVQSNLIPIDKLGETATAADAAMNALRNGLSGDSSNA